MRLLQYKYAVDMCLLQYSSGWDIHILFQDGWATDHELILAKNSRLIVSVAAFWITPDNPLYITNMLLYYSGTPLNCHPWFVATLSIADTHLGPNCIAIQNSTLPIPVGQREREGLLQRTPYASPTCFWLSGFVLRWVLHTWSLSSPKRKSLLEEVDTQTKLFSSTTWPM